MSKFKTEDFIRKSQEIYGNKYDYSLVEYKNNHTIVDIVCPKHGIFKKRPCHFYNLSECPDCIKEQKVFLPTLNDFVSLANKIHNNKYDYSLVEYKNNYTKVKIICSEHGIFEQKPYYHVKGHGCDECGKNNRKLTTTSFIQQAIEKHGNKFSYEKTKVDGVKNKVIVNCRKHGEFKINIYSHLKCDGGCLECKKEKLKKLYTSNNHEFIEKSLNIHNDKYEYNNIRYKSCYEKIEITCNKHGPFWQQPNNHLTGYGCPSCGIRTSKYEDYLEKYFIKNNIGYLKNDKKILNGLELDFYLPDHKLAIEVNGIYWHSELKGKDKNYHLNKTKLCKDKDVRLIHLSSSDMSKTNIQSYLNSIFKINKRKLYARKCIVKEIDSKTKSKFLNKYHFQTNDSSSIYLGLFYNNKLVSIMTFCKYRKGIGNGVQKEKEYELSRFCNNFNFYVIGGASKLLKYFERNYKPVKIKTYADIGRSNGNMYFKLGFNHTHDSKPNYWYFHKSNTDKIYHRFNFRKSVLNKKLDKFDINLTEWVNMQNNGWDRYWDCGTMVFEKYYKNS